jgi:hypothetical protein
MNTLHALWESVIKRPVEAFWGLVWALLIWLVTDPFLADSRILALIRHSKNKFAERSFATLSRRINEQQRQRDRIAAYLASDKGLYLDVLKFILGVLMLSCLGGAIILVGRIMWEVGLEAGRPGPPLDLFALPPIGLAIFLAMCGIHWLTSTDTQEKVSERIAKLDGEIAKMRTKLHALSQK